LSIGSIETSTGGAVEKGEIQSTGAIKKVKYCRFNSQGVAAVGVGERGAAPNATSEKGLAQILSNHSLPLI